MATLHHDAPFPHDGLLEELARSFAERPEPPRTSDAHALADALNERLRLARELHDGLLQALTGISLQLDAVGHLVEQCPKAAREMVNELQEQVVEHQHELRRWIENARHPAARSEAVRSDARAVLEKICHRASRWGPRVEVRTTACERMPDALFGDVCRLVEEGLSNVRKHARARIARVEVAVAKRALHIVIEDDGSGFPFRGRYDLDMLESRRLGPASIKERVASLRGSLVLTSSLSGARLEIGLPLVIRIHRVSRNAS
jgi:signal transduction histidine kinase